MSLSYRLSLSTLPPQEGEEVMIRQGLIQTNLDSHILTAPIFDYRAISSMMEAMTNGSENDPKVNNKIIYGFFDKAGREIHMNNGLELRMLGTCIPYTPKEYDVYVVDNGVSRHRQEQIIKCMINEIYSFGGIKLQRKDGKYLEEVLGEEKLEGTYFIIENPGEEEPFSNYNL